MRKMKTPLLLALALLSAPQGHAALLAHWGFDSYTGGNDSADILNYATGGNFTFGIPTPTATTGTTVGINTGYSATSASQFAASQTTDATAFTLSLTIANSVQSLILTKLGFAAQNSTTDSTTLTWSYQITGGGSGSLGTDTLSEAPANTWRAYTHNTGISLSGGQQITFSALINRDGTGNRNTTFDNLDLEYGSLTLVPEPVHYALAGFAFIAVAVRLVRRVMTRRWAS